MKIISHLIFGIVFFIVVLKFNGLHDAFFFPFFVVFFHPLALLVVVVQKTMVLKCSPIMNRMHILVPVCGRINNRTKVRIRQNSEQKKQTYKTPTIPKIIGNQ